MRKTAWVATCWALLLSGCSDSDSKGSGAGTSGSSVKAATSGASGKPVVEMETSMGTVVLELDPEHAPITVENFLKYVDDGFYAGTIFHRVMPNFMIQGGGFEPGMGQKSTRSPIKNEATNGLKNVRGSIAMARTGDPHSATAQFFINVVDNAGLDHPGPGPSGWGYCVFGKVVSGMDVVDKIKSVSTTRKGPHENVPVEDVIIKSMKRKK
ncbi:MAG: peptidyl-prolyl cis-trans isomerase [Phycisphaerae bacterium]|nr:peptidyl-prolyl cis-trans isomerase [Phycisphaerae bacterium]